MRKFFLLAVIILFSGQAAAEVLYLEPTTIYSKKLLSEKMMRGELKLTYMLLVENFDEDKLEITFEETGVFNLTRSFDVGTAEVSWSYEVTYFGVEIPCVSVKEKKFTPDEDCAYNYPIPLRFEHKRLPLLRNSQNNEPLST